MTTIHIPVTLEDERYCDRCSCLRYTLSRRFQCTWSNEFIETVDDKAGIAKRPTRCIEELG